MRSLKLLDLTKSWRKDKSVDSHLQNKGNVSSRKIFKLLSLKTMKKVLIDRFLARRGLAQDEPLHMKVKAAADVG